MRLSPNYHGLVGIAPHIFDWKKTGEVARNNAYSMKREDDMRKNDLRGLIACAALAVVPMMMVTVAVAQAPPAPQPPAPQIAPVLVPSHVVDLMTEDGISAFGARPNVAADHVCTMIAEEFLCDRALASAGSGDEDSLAGEAPVLGDGGEITQLVQLHWPKPNPTGTVLLPVHNRRAAPQKQSFLL